MKYKTLFQRDLRRAYPPSKPWTLDERRNPINLMLTMICDEPSTVQTDQSLNNGLPHGRPCPCLAPFCRHSPHFRGSGNVAKTLSGST